MTARAGTVYLVGAGPGDPDLITRRGLELLRAAHVVLYDRLVSQALLEEALPDADLIDVGKAPYATAASQDDINAALVRLAKDGRIVVRLKGGDPFVFGRGYEEQQACEAAGVPCEVVPGISSALAAPMAAGIPVTLRGLASMATICAAPAIREEQWPALAAADTLVVLMGVRELPQIAARLVAEGRDPRTPVAIVSHATLPTERVLRSTLGEVGIEAGAHATRGSGLRRCDEYLAIEAPAVIVVGATAALGASQSPLTGRRIVVTRPRPASHTLVRELRTLGADVQHVPLIRITRQHPAASALVRRLGGFDWIVFTSRHGVRGFRSLLRNLGADARALRSSRLAVVGPGTARTLEQWGLRPDLVASPARAEALVEALLGRDVLPRHVLHPCGSLAGDVLTAGLVRGGVATERLEVYRTVPVVPDERTASGIASGADAIVLASPSAAAALGRSGADLRHIPMVCIGPTTADAARAEGWHDVHVAREHSDRGLVDAVVALVHERVSAL
ncbi:MAG: uroporphyrinogen-III C-methyltransferase [Gemmatimonadaceae bacterium]